MSKSVINVNDVLKKKSSSMPLKKSLNNMVNDYQKSGSNALKYYKNTEDNLKSKKILAKKEVFTKNINRKKATDKSLSQNKKALSKQEQSDSKVVAKYKQSSSKVVAKSSSKVVAKYKQSSSRKNESGSKVVAKNIKSGSASGSKSGSKKNKSGSKVVAKSTFFQLAGLQKNLIKIFYFSCKTNGQKTTKPLSMQYLKETLKTSIGTLKNAVRRLIIKGFITKHSFKDGRGGWTQYKLENFVYTELLENESGSKVVAFKGESSSKVVAQVVAQVVADRPSSSSSNLNTTTTSVNKTDKNGYLDVVKIPEEIKKIGFRETQIEQISKIGKLSVEELETSLEHFSFDLGEGHIRAKTNPLNMLMGILRHGVYTSSEYLKEEETALENELRGLRERKKRRDDLLKEKQELLFEEWLEPKSKDEIVAIVPTPMNSNEFYMQGIHKELLFNHFVENEMELFKGFQQ